MPALVPTHNSIDLLEHFSQYIGNSIHPILIDDRSTEDVVGFAESKGWSWIKCQNNFGFNYSVLMNYGALTLHQKGFATACFLNNDCYIVRDDFFQKFLLKHLSSGSSISGIKLLYPPKELSFHKTDMAPAVGRFFGVVDHVNRVQFGGGSVNKNGVPYHSDRFAESDSPSVNCDKQVDFVTGACNLVQLDDFLAVGGYTNSLATAYQDVELAKRLYPQWYFGKDIWFYHDESLSRISENAFAHDAVDATIYKALISK